MAEIHHIDENTPHKSSEVVCLKCLKREIAIRPVVALLRDLECECGEVGFMIETGEEIFND